MRIENNTALSTPLFVGQDEPFQSHQSSARRFCRVLVVDDDELVRASLAALLEAAQYEVEVAATGEDALRVLNATQCQIVLTDWQMPDMDGLALCRRVRLELQESYVYVVMLTVRNTDSDMLTGLAAGADDYVVKGTPVEQILARLEVGRRITRRSQFRATQHETLGLTDSDSITDAHSLGYLLHHLPRELERSRRGGHPMAVLTCNINGFAPHNEPFGSAPGDDALRSFVTGVKGCIRKADWVARTGHNLFMVVLPETTAKGAQCVAKKLTRLFSLNPISTSAGPGSLAANIEVTAVTAQHGAHTALQISSLLRVAQRLSYLNQLHSGDYARTNGLN
ncbi:MAG: two-component system, cell cycle response regulator [Gammaproteobacteria bacterium]|jgi:two-component system chemotaxis response regulator CheY|nr:two-component system, cell cycle response regulator [Gammaproteobacteria bacterium]